LTRLQLRIAWVLALALVAASVWRAASLGDPYRSGVRVGTVEDRREHRFRDLTWSETQHLLKDLLESASRAPDAAARARALARLAALQQERGLAANAAAAAHEALRLAPEDPEVRRLLTTPLEFRRPVR
jgi:hypothetical protein